MTLLRRPVRSALAVAAAAALTAGCAQPEPPAYVQSKGDDPRWCGTAVAYATDTANRIDAGQFGGSLSDKQNLDRIKALGERAEKARHIKGLPTTYTDFLKQVHDLTEQVVKAKGVLGPLDQAAGLKVLNRAQEIVVALRTDCPATTDGQSLFGTAPPVGKV